MTNTPMPLNKALDFITTHGKSLWNLAYNPLPETEEMARTAFDTISQAHKENPQDPDLNGALAYCLYFGIGTRQDREQASQQATNYPSQNKINAQNDYILSQLLYNDYMVTESPVILSNLINKLLNSSKQDFPEANTKLGRYLLNGYHLEKNIPLAKTFFENAARKGDAEAQNFLGLMAMDGEDGEEPDYNAAKTLFIQSAEGRFTPAIANLTRLLEKLGDHNPLTGEIVAYLHAYYTSPHADPYLLQELGRTP